jgi:amino acid adenylation domain-containing protein
VPDDCARNGEAEGGRQALDGLFTGQRMTEQRRATTGPPPPDQSITERFERQVRLSPDAVAVLAGYEELTYAELDVRANRLAHQLKACGLQRDDRVGISLERSPDLIAAVLGVLKAGGAYVPLDPSYPLERLSFIARDAACLVLLHDGAPDALLTVRPWKTLTVGAAHNADPRDAVAPPPVASRPGDLAYVIYTSGSTGQPKGVAIEHRNVLNLVEWALETFSRDDLRGMLASTSISFDLSVFEMFVPLSVGGTIILVENLLALSESPASSRVTLVNTVPSIMREFLRLSDLPPTARIVALAGEPLHASLVDRLYEIPSVEKVFDLYGPTETTVYATCAHRVRGGPVTIGRPISNMQACVFDEDRRPVEPGADGELYLGGAGLARGYLGRADLTAERFVPHPEHPATERLYRTGDRVRWMDDGGLEFLGRLDRQVKVRGYRVELGEIESALVDHPALHEAAVVTRGTISDEVRLIAYIVEDTPSTDEDIYSYLERRLPACMIPTMLVRLDELPRLPNGKVNHATLPLVAARVAEPGRVAGVIEPGHDSLPEFEAGLADIWRQVLGARQLSVDDNFFDVGGNSLLAVRLFTEIDKQFGLSLPPTTLFRSGTIATQARLLASSPPADVSSPLVPLQPTGSRPPFFLVHGIGGEVFGFNDLVKHTGSDQPIYGLRAHSRDGNDLVSSIEDLASTYVRAIRSLVPCGPYYIGGYSAGGVIAYEMAQQFLAAGEQVGLLVILDAAAPGPHEYLTPAACWRWVVNACYWPLDDDFFRTGVSDQLARVHSKAKAMREFSRQAIGMKPSETVDVRDLLGLWNVPANAREYLERYVRMMDAYRATEYDGEITVLRARTLSLSYRGTADLGWRRLARSGVSLHIVPGAHDTILMQPRVRLLAAVLVERLERAFAATTSGHPLGAPGRDHAPVANERRKSSVVL